ncbi:hypothetical protein VNI00_003653 [Paramarasmius palmivorus]|uniref:Uncharacterized protein n=1 Tax=Paramarasmius palmivorus TaxID=297713 RepID=A0AAW0DSX5_9AGAR
MKFFSLAFFLLPFLLVAAQDDDCEPGWEAVEFPPDSGNIICRRTEIRCPLQQEPYKNAETNADSCCPISQQLVIYDKDSKKGVCCGADQVYRGTAPNGKCCAKDLILKDGKCVPAPPPSACPSCPSAPPGACALQAACGDGSSNGLKFGSCYQVLFPSGGQLGRGVTYGTTLHPDMYSENGYIQNIPYRICKAATGDCGTGPVKAADSTGANGDDFVIEDGLGPAGGPATKGWLNNANGGGHMEITTAPANARVFRARSSCSGCKCTVQLISSGFACPGTQPGITWWDNPKVTLKLQFLEIPCSGKYNFPQLN